MKNIRNLFFAAACGAALLLTACLGGADSSGFDPETPQIAFESQSVTIETLGGDFEVALLSNLPWRVKCDVPWISLATINGPGNGSVQFSVARNRTSEERTGIITAWITDDSTAQLVLTQQPADVAENFIYFVKTDGDALASGLSWDEATTLSTAIEMAGDGDVICLAAGTYTPVALIPGGESQEERTFEIHSNFTLEGGYPADASEGAQPDPAANETVLSGNLGSISAYHVVIVTAAKSAQHRATLKNLTISDGVGMSVNGALTRSVNGSSFDAGQGGGLVVGYSNLDVIDCRITDNEACHAGGVDMRQGSEVSFVRTTIANNAASTNGGGIWNEGGTVYMDGCTISGNTSGGQCGGYYSIDAGGTRTVSRISNTTFADNDNTRTTANRSGGAAYIRAGSDAVFTNCTFTGNKAGYGGAIASHGASASNTSSTMCISCTFTNNSATTGGGALLVYNNYADIVVHNSIISGNAGPAESLDTGLISGVETQHLKIYASIVGSGLLDKDGSAASGGWSFSASTMLGELGYYAGGPTRTYPLVVSDTNPAVGQGLTVNELKDLAASCSPAVDAGIVAADQNGTPRGGRSIGAVTAQ